MKPTRPPSADSLNYEGIFSATASAYLVLDIELFIVGVNDAYLRVTDRTRENLLGRYVFDAFPDNPSDPHANGVSLLHESLQRVLQTGKADQLEMLQYDIPVGEDGSTFERRYWQPINTPVYGRQGKLTLIVHQAIDITARVASETAQRESEHRFRALSNATGDVIYRMSPDWSYMHELDGRGFLKDTGSLSQYRIADYVPAEDLEEVQGYVDEAIRKKATFDREHRVLRADGTYGWTHSRAVPILQGDGEIREWIGSASDITARKLAAQELQDANRRKDEFLAMLAHELRNPLAPITTAAYLLKAGAKDEARVRYASQVIERQAAHMTALVNDLLDVSRVTRGLIKLQKGRADLGQIISAAVEQVTPLVESRHHELNVELSPEGAVVSADKERLVQVIANLLSNAAKFTDPGGRLRLATHIGGEHVRIEVTDNGIGMSAHTALHAFELFSQAELSADRAGGGLGIGLSLVKSLVELHGGTVSGVSEGIGQGSTFTITLPLAQH